MNEQFLEAVFTDSIQHPNFFNGRILTAQDLRDEQAANLKQSRYLGQAIGTGVVYGLTVMADPSQKALIISKGLAVNPRGDGLYLPQDTTVKLVLASPVVATSASPFVPCDVAGATTLTGVVSNGFYLLAISNATRLSVTMAPNSGLTGDHTGCTNRYEELGVQFKLVPLADEDFVRSIAPTAKDGRSRLAHVCFGTNQLKAVMNRPAEGLVEYGLMDALRIESTNTETANTENARPKPIKRLTACDVPLAVFQFQPSTLQFVDQWAVRRPAIPAMHLGTYGDNGFTPFVSPRRAVEASAFLLQFQAHLEDLRSSIIPSEVVAQDYFEYLPAAGYLPVQLVDSPSDRNFKVKKFFGVESVTEQRTTATLLRSLFHESLYGEPIRPGVDPVDIYHVDGAETYRIFVRRVPILLAEPEPKPEPSEEEPPTIQTGNLIVTVLSERGDVVPDSLIRSIQAGNLSTKEIYTAQRSQIFLDKPLRVREYQKVLEEDRTKVRDKYAVTAITDIARAAIEFPVGKKKPFVYQFDELPTGAYVVRAIPTSQKYVGITSRVKVEANIDNFVVVVIRPVGIRLPKDYFVPKEALTSKGVLLNGFRVNPKWIDIYPNWEKDIFGVNPVVDPPPDQWIKYDDSKTQVGLEEVLALNAANSDRLVTSDAAVYIRADYNPTQVTDTVVAFVQTPDGSRFPAVPVAKDNALDKPALVDRTEIPDYDRATVDQLKDAGLADVDAIASAPTNLIAAVLGQSPQYSRSLIGDTRTSLKNDFREGYLGYAGITKTQSEALKTQFKGGKVDLANAPLAEVTAALGNVSSGFANRFLTGVRDTLPTRAFSLEGTGISAASISALAARNVTSNQDLIKRAASDIGRAELKQTLQVDDTILNRYLEKATLNMAQAELLSAPETSIGTLEAIPEDIKASLVAAGIGSAKEVANAVPGELAAITGASIADTTAIISSAAAYGSKARVLLVAGVTQGAVTAAAATEAMHGTELAGAGAIAQASETALTAIGMSQNAAQQMKSLSGQLLLKTNFRRFQ